MNILFIIKANIFMLIKWLYKPSQVCWLLSLERLANSKHIVRSIFETHVFGVFVVGSTCDHVPLEYKCPIIRVSQIRGTSIVVVVGKYVGYDILTST